MIYNKNYIKFVEECLGIKLKPYQKALLLKLIETKDKIQVVMSRGKQKLLLNNNYPMVLYTKSNKNCRGYRAKTLTYWSDWYQCFVEFDGYRDDEEQYRYLLLDENGDKVYIEKPEVLK